ncbi:carboxymuconolactone decarboxylase family protein [Candidatus Bipolaricaulota bacterium]|nr:carboxymuconolactone decarboxylase family protein [Candidatus Bipolaricaulota bacterium]
MRLLAEWFPEFAEKFDEIDEIYRDKRSIDEKTYQFICFALSIKNRSKPCLLKHFKGAMEAGATLKELSYIMALTFRESAGGDDCWTHDALGDVKKLLADNIQCCPK